MSHVTKISGNDIKDKELRETMNSDLKSSIASINDKIEMLRIAIMAIGQVVLGLCDTIEHLSEANAIKQKYYGTFYNTSSVPDGSGYTYYRGALDNLASVILNLAESPLDDGYRNGGTTKGGNSKQRWENAKNICYGNNAYDYYYQIGNKMDGQINPAISWDERIMHNIIEKTTGRYRDITTYLDSNIF